jgi:transposase
VVEVIVEPVVTGAGGYPSDLTDEQWTLVELLLPPPRTGPKGGRREKHPRRRIVDAIFYVVRTGCAWRQLPKDFPPWQTVYWYFVRWHDEGTVTRVHDALRAQVRRAEGRSEEPSAGLIDSQSVRTADTVPAATRGFDAGKKVKGRKRFLVTDTLGLLLAVHVMTASIQDRDGAKRPLLWARLDHPSVRKVWADQGFTGRLVDWTAQILGRELEIVRKDPGQRGFRVQPKRWAIERTFSWLTAHRRLARDYEHHPARAETMIRWAMISVMVRRLARGCPATRPGPRPLRRIAAE